MSMMPMVALLLVLVQGASPAPSVVRVAAASDLRFALDEVARRLAGQIAVRATYGSSGTLHAQLQQRAPYDLFLSADVAYPDDLVRRGLARREDLFHYAVGRLVVWVPTGSSLPIERDGLRALAAAGRVALANPLHAPYGRAARAALERVDLWSQLQSRLVLGDSVTQAAQFVESGGADAGLIARSLAVASPMRGRGRWRDIPADLHPPLLQAGVLMPGAPDAAGVLRAFLTGPEGRALLERHGFERPRS